MDELKKINEIVNYIWKAIKNNEATALSDDEAWETLHNNDLEMIASIENDDIQRWAYAVAGATEILIEARARSRR